LASSSVWTPSIIAQNLKILKSYFFEFEEKTYPMVQVRYTTQIPVLTDFRLMNVNITYSPEMFGNVKARHPLHTRVNCSLELATDLQVGLKGGQKTASIDKKEQQTPLRDAIPAWY